MISSATVRNAVSQNSFFEELECRDQNGSIVIKVHIKGIVNAGRIPLWLNYNIGILISKKFPKDLPLVIDYEKLLDVHFEHINPDRTLCLATPIELRNKLVGLHPEKVLLELILGYMTQYAYWQQFSCYLIEPQQHGLAGILADYGNRLGVEKLATIVDFLKCIQNPKVNANKPCPCRSVRSLRACHMRTLSSLCPTVDAWMQMKTDLEELSSWQATIRQKIQYGRDKTPMMPLSCRQLVDGFTIPQIG